ncbi:MAG: TetR/AcrR family transcriptional regulator [Polyangiaceae bacterium]|nr:TetR/AcrR family transcriptional regulator [Polyangiaceae bacterium]
MTEAIQPTTSKRLERGEPVVAKVLDATIQEIAMTGYDGLTLERVAARAGVNRTTIYRRWPTKAALTRATIERLASTVKFDFDTGSMRGDLRGMIEAASRTLFAPGALGLVRLLLNTADDDDVRELALCVQEEKRNRAFAMLDRWQSRGEMRDDIDKEMFLDSMMGVLFRRNVFLRQPVTKVLTERMLDHFCQIAAPVRKGALPARARPERAKAKTSATSRFDRLVRPRKK